MFSRFLLIMIITVSLYSCTNLDSNRPLAINGIIDLSGIDINNSTGVKLDGEWEFYWKEFISDTDAEDTKLLVPDYIKIPSRWTEYPEYNTHGFGTYMLTITGLNPSDIYSVHIPAVSSSYKIWVDGKLLSELGVAGVNKEDSVPSYRPNIVSFCASDQTTNIVMHISNYHHRSGGPWGSLVLGSPETINSQRIQKVILEIFMVGILFCMAVFHLRVFYYRNEEVDELLFSLICISLLLRVVATGEYLISFIIPTITWGLVWRLEALSLYFVVPLILILMSHLFPKEVNRSLNKALYLLHFIFGLAFNFFPGSISNHLIPCIQIVLLLSISYVMNIVIRAIRSREFNAMKLAIGFLLWFLTALSDTFVSNSIYFFPFISPLGFIVLVFIQSDVLASRFTKSFTQRDILVKSRDEFRSASITDSLTGLYNVRYLNNFLKEQLVSSEGDNYKLSVIMIDVDNFKQFNDTHGHKKGDLVLKELAHVMKSSARDIDVPCRYGGEEFTVVLPNTPLTIAGEIAERIRFNFEIKGSSTISVGVAEHIPGESGDQVIERADKALYNAKHSGKNRVVLG